jgi:hypothetical protein
MHHYGVPPPRSRLVFDRLKNFLPSEIDIVISLGKKILQPIKSISDLSRQLVQFPTWLLLSSLACSEMNFAGAK